MRMEILERLSEKFAEDFDAMNLTNVAWACAVLAYRPSGSILNRVGANMITKAQASLKSVADGGSDRASPSVQALTNSLWAFATLQHPMAPELAGVVAKATPRLMDQFDARLAGVGGAFNTQTVANQLWAYASIQHHPGNELMDAFAALVTQHVEDFNSQELSNAMWSYAALSHFPGDDFMRVVEIEMAKRVGSFTTQGATNNIVSVAHFQHSDVAARAGLHSFMSALDHELSLNQVKHYSAKGLALSIWGVSVLGGFSSKFYRRLWEHCAEPSSDRSTLIPGLDRNGNFVRMLYQSHLLMKAVAPRLAESMPAPDWLHTVGKDAWHKQVSDTRPSSFQANFARHLTGMKVPHRQELVTEDRNLSLDVALDDYRIAFECDGPWHFSVNAGVGSLGSVPLSRNLVRDTLMNASGWHVITVPWDDWTTHRDRGKGKEWIARSSNKFGVCDLSASDLTDAPK
mmetsp:Transcript_18435/g.45915  ORF Transcript_18435/g.45915 Transcript_18435/m.45915 type:complete len:459 (-) Transcript_18435:215-1591(-)